MEDDKLIYFYEHNYRYYLRCEKAERCPLSGEIVGNRSGTFIAPPDNWEEGKIPVFDPNKETWTIVDDTFWHPSYKEINYDAGRRMETYTPFICDMLDFYKFPSVSQLFNSGLYAVNFTQSIRVINKKMLECVEMHRKMSQPQTDPTALGGFMMMGRPKGGGYHEIDILNAVKPSILSQYNAQCEELVYHMRRLLDCLVQLTSLLTDYETVNNNKKFTFDSIGQCIHHDGQSPVKDIILGNEDDNYEVDQTKFLKIINDLFNGMKHSLLHEEIKPLVGVDVPTIRCLHGKRGGYKDIIYYHNHNIYHIMMGFEDCVRRILKNQDIYREMHE